MSPTTSTYDADWDPVARVFDRPELCALVARYSGFVGAWRLTGVSRTFREGSRAYLSALPRLVICGGLKKEAEHVDGDGDDDYDGEATNEVWMLDLVELRWVRMPSLTHGRDSHACCAVRGGVVVLGGWGENQEGHGERTTRKLASVEILGCRATGVEEDDPTDSTTLLPPLSCGPI